MEADGNLVVHLGKTPLWHARTGNNPGAQLNVQNDGNAVIHDGARLSGPPGPA